jgi:hypothetical protein
MAKAIGEQVLMTRNIATNVTETTGAAVEVTMRVQQVALEANQTGQQARRVDDVCSEVADHVRSLHTTLIRIVRTCSAEIDRRNQERISFDQEPAEVELKGRRFRVVLNDVSRGGAQLQGKVGVDGDHVILRLRGLPEAISGRVINQTDERTHVKFDRGQSVLNGIENLLADRRKGRQAA